MNKLHVWLAYAACPVTIAVYFERALRQCCRTTTIGPPLSPGQTEYWQKFNIKLPLKAQDISTDPAPDMQQILSETDPTDYPDLYLWIESADTHYPKHLDKLNCPKACYLTDSHRNLSRQLEWARHFDLVFIAQRQYLNDFRTQGMQVHWLPPGCDPEVHFCAELSKEYPVGFAGYVHDGSRRENLLKALSGKIPLHYERCFQDDMARLFCQSKIVLNESAGIGLNRRIFEVMSTGSLLLTDMAKDSGQDELFRDGEDYAVYRDSTICNVASFYLGNEKLLKQIAVRGQRLVYNAHTYDHRIADLLAVSLKGKPTTFSAAELRERSLASVPPIDSEIPESCFISNSTRSFIIPVLDLSPASEYNILTLLKDLEDIEGDVIVIFNGQEIAEQLKEHPRITRYAIMKQNIGVARAWNLGLEIAATKTAFILNADLHVQYSAISILEEALNELPDAACVGPQGSFFDFTLIRDYKYFDKGSFNHPLEVDAVSGFFFAIKLEHFNQKIIRFENGFTPCYFEEWDLGLQVKQAGLKNYVVPTTAYDHHWSGSIRALREICFYEKAETAGNISMRNRQNFLNKWRGIAGRENNPQLLESGFFSYAIEQSHNLITEGNYSEAQNLLSVFNEDHPNIAALLRFVAIQQSKQTIATN